MAPGLLIDVDDDRKLKAFLFDCGSHIGWIALRACFGTMDSQNGELLTAELLFPTLVPRVIANAVNSSKGKEVQGNDLATQVGQFQARSVDPLPTVDDLRCLERHVSQLAGVEVLANQFQ